MRIVFLVCTFVLAACQPAYLKDGRPNENSPYFEVSVQSKFVLHQTLTIPPYRRHIYFQHGKAMPFHKVNEFIDYCALTLHAQRQVPQTVKPDTFVVTKVYREYLFQLASATMAVTQVMDIDGGETWQVLATQMELRSETQPDVVRMTCAGWGLPQELSNVTVAGIRKSLGDIVTLEMADPHTPVTPTTEPRRRREGSGY
jgi:hypothetical protein